MGAAEGESWWAQRSPETARSSSSTWRLPGFRRSFAGLFSLLLLCQAATAQELTFAVSQDGLDQMSGFGFKMGMGMLDNLGPMELLAQSKSEPGLGPMAQVNVRNVLGLRQLALLLEQDSLGVQLRDFRLYSELDLAAYLWPLPAWPLFGHLGEEQLTVNLTLPQVYIGLSPDNPSPVGPNTSPNARIRVSACTVADPALTTTAHNYWLVGALASAGASWARSRLPDLICSQVREQLGAMLRQTSGTILPGNFLAGAPAPFNKIILPNLQLRYALSTLRVLPGQLAASVSLHWLGPISHTADYVQDFSNFTDLPLPPVGVSPQALRDPARSQPRAERLTEMVLEVSGKAPNQHLTIWLHPDFLNQMFTHMDFDILLMKDKVPVVSEKIPARSRKFMSVMCPRCFFMMNAFAYGPPQFSVSPDNATINVATFLRVRLVVHNPNSEDTAPFIEFVSMFGIALKPKAEAGVIRIDVALSNVKVDMRNSAFPTEWDFFVKDLVEGMIHGMIWPEIQVMIHDLTLVKGIRVPDAVCGIDPASLSFYVREQRMGLGFALTLDQIDDSACRAGLDKNFQNLKLSGGGGIGKR